jgi:hypothetical protein
MITGFTYFNQVDISLNDVVENNVSSNYIVLSLLAHKYERDIHFNSYLEKLEEIKNINSVNGVIIRSYFQGLLGMNITSIENSSIIIDDIVYIGENDYSYTFLHNDSSIFNINNYSVPFEIEFISLENMQISINEYVEYHNKFDSDLFLYGREMENTNEILLSDFILKKYGFDEKSLYSLLNKSITLEYKTKDEVISFDNYTLVGIIDSNFFRINSRRSSPHIILPLEATLHIEEIVLYCYVFVDCFSNTLTIKNQIEAQVDSQVFFNEATYFTYFSLTNQKYFIKTAFFSLFFVLSLSIIISIINNNLFAVKQKGTYYGTLKAIGFLPKDIFLQHTFEFLILGIISLAISLIISYVFMISLNSILSSLLIVEFKISIVFLIKISIIALLVIIMLSMIISIFVYIWYRKYSVCKLLLRE